FLMRAARRAATLGSQRGGGKTPPELRDHVFVIGYGVTGQAVARVRRETGIAFAAVDIVAEVVKTGRDEGIPVRFGDASRRAVLEERGAAHARAAVIAVSDPSGTRRIVGLLRQMNPRAR